jgi:hypothetical protein
MRPADWLWLSLAMAIIIGMLLADRGARMPVEDVCRHQWMVAHGGEQEPQPQVATLHTAHPHPHLSTALEGLL